MNTKLLMTASATIMGGAGILLSFLPHEIISFFQSSPVDATVALLLQTMGALYFGFAMINWTAKANLIGGIYGRPVAIGNFVHFIVGALALLKGYISSQVTSLVVPAITYLLFALAFGYVLFTHPLKESKE